MTDIIEDALGGGIVDRGEKSQKLRGSQIISDIEVGMEKFNLIA